MIVIDVDDERTWPQPLSVFVERLAARNRSATTCDQLVLPPSGAIDSFLVGVRLRAYHGTRLLDSEIAALRVEGLRPLEGDLVRRKVSAATAAGLLDEQAAIELVESCDGLREDIEREREVCFAVSRAQLDAESDGLIPFMSSWGGERIQQAAGIGSPEHARLTLFGRPTIVVAQIDVDGRDTYRDLVVAFVGAKLGFRDRHGEVNHAGAVPPDRIEAIWHPSDPEYDRHASLPRD